MTYAVTTLTFEQVMKEVIDRCGNEPGYHAAVVVCCLAEQQTVIDEITKHHENNVTSIKNRKRLEMTNGSSVQIIRNTDDYRQYQGYLFRTLVYLAQPYRDLHDVLLSQLREEPTYFYPVVK